MLIRIALALSLAGASLAAQTLTPGEPHAGTLGPEDARSGRGAPMDVWTLTVPADHAVQIAETADFDTFLHARLADGTELTDDDGGNGTNSALLILNPGDGPVEVMPSAFEPDAAGEYTLEATLLPVERLDDSGAHVGTQGREATLLGFTLPANVPMLVEVTSGDFDPVLEIALPGGVVRRDDDGGEGRNALLLLQSPERVEVRAAVTAFRGRGEFRLETARVAFDGDVDLASEDEATLQGSAFQVTGEDGQRVRLMAGGRRINAMATDSDPQRGDGSLLATMPGSGRLAVLLDESGTLDVRDEGLPVLPAFLTDAYDQPGAFVVVAHAAWDARPLSLNDVRSLRVEPRLGIALQTVEVGPASETPRGWMLASDVRNLDGTPDQVAALGRLLPTGHLVALPTVFLADGEGRLIDIWNGPFRVEDLQAWIQEGLAGD